VDSDSSTNSISSRVIDSLHQVELMDKPIQVWARVDDGGIMWSEYIVPNCNWESGGTKFYSEFKVLLLKEITSDIEWAGDDHLIYITTESILRSGLQAFESKRYLFVESGSKNTRFIFYLDISKQNKELAVLTPCVYGVDTTPSHRGNHFFVKRRSDELYNSELVACPLDNVAEITSPDHCSSPELQDLLHTRQQMLQQVQMHLQRAQVRMKREAGKGRMERSFSVGDRVYVKLQPYCQSSAAEIVNRKLAFKFFGPLSMVRKVNSVAYEVALPEGSNVHPVFHVSQLKSFVPANVIVSSFLPALTQDYQIPEEVMDSRLQRRAGKEVPQLLVRWTSWPPSVAIWEDEHWIKEQFPRAPAWGQAVSKGGGDVNDAGIQDGIGKATQGGRRRITSRRRGRRCSSSSGAACGPQGPTRGAAQALSG
jgi:translation initiation factor IF-1